MAPPVPKLLVPCSNGEHDPVPPSALAREAGRRALAAADATARRLGLSRRDFLRTSMGGATTLFALAACAGEQRAARVDDGVDAPGGTFAVPEESTTDPAAADEAIGPAPAEVVVDVQTHFLDEDLTIDQWADLVLNGSDTSIAVLSALPVVDPGDNPMSIEKMETARRLGETLCGDGRVLLQGEAFPQVGELAATLDRMTEVAEGHPLAAWKTYTHVGRAYSFADDVGQAFLAHIEDLVADGIGPPVLAVHKGFGADPADLGPAAAAHPGLTFLAYHSGFEPQGPRELDFREDGPGVDRLVRSLRDAGIGPGGNVYCELGSTWKNVLTDPDAAAHVLGKLLVAVGPERILWGTDSIWYGSPQDQIEAFRSFQITPAFQEAFGYPELTMETKRLVLGGNAARIHGLDLATVAAPCRFSTEERQAAREQALAPLGPWGDRNLGPTTAAQARQVFRREHPWFA